MQQSPHSQAPSKTDARPGVDPQAFVSQLIRSFPDHQPFRAADILEQHPFLNEHRSCVIDLAYEEFCRLREAGAGIRPTEFAGRYRGIEQSLHRVIEFDQILQQHPSFIESIPEDQWPTAGDSFCGCTLLEQIGRGVLSRVFVARQDRLGNRRVVAKVCARGEQEASLLGQLQHPAIAAVFSIDTDPVSGLSMICMPYLTRVTLHHVTEWLHRSSQPQPLTVSAILDIVDRINADDATLNRPAALQRSAETAAHDLEFTDLFLQWGIALADALETAHHCGILHCDVKPGNVLVLPDLSVQLLDFNLAATTTGTACILGGTMPYMASEQLQQILQQSQRLSSTGSGAAISATPATDVFGLCATLWHLLSGAPPFGVGVDADDREQAARTLLQRHASGVSADDIARAAARVPADIVQLLVSGLSAEPASRPCSAAELARQFRRLQTMRQPALSATSAAELSSPGMAAAGRRRPLRRALLTAAGMLLAGTAVLGRFGGLPGPSADARTSEARELLEAAKAGEAEVVLRQALRLDPHHAAAGLLLSHLLISQERYAEALAVLQDQPASAEDSTATFLTLYCRAALLPMPIRTRNSERLTAVDSQPQPQQAWQQLIAEWSGLAGTPELGTRALVNAAAMQFEMGEFRDAEDLLEQLPARHEVTATEQRLERCLRLQQSLLGRELLPTADWQALRQSPPESLSRYELWTLLMVLARSASDPECTSPPLADPVGELRQMLTMSAGTRIEPFALRSLMTEPIVRHDRGLAEQLGKLVIAPCDAVTNPLPALLTLPPQPGDASLHASLPRQL